MASSSGNSSSVSTTQLWNSGSEEDLQQLVDERRRKRTQSNRESARRCGMRKQKHLDGLRAQVDQLSNDNDQVLTNINLTTQQFNNFEAENSILRAQMIELRQRLESLNEIRDFINSSTSDSNNNNGPFDHQPTMASADHTFPY